MDNVFNVQTVFLLCTGLLTFLCENTVNPFPLPQRVKKPFYILSVMETELAILFPSLRTSKN